MTTRSPALARSRRARRTVVQARSDAWIHDYTRRVTVTDTLIVIAVVFGAQMLRYGPVSFDDHVGRARVPIGLVSLGVVAAWLLMLRMRQSLDRRVIAAGPTEYSRVVSACFLVFATLAIVDLLFVLNIARSFVALAFPLGTVALLTSRWSWRSRLTHRRRRRLDLDRVVVIGGIATAQPLIEHLDRNPELGYDVIGLCVPPEQSEIIGPLAANGRSIPILGEFADARAIVETAGASTVAVTSAEALGHSAMRELSWDLEGLDVQMVVAPGLLDVAGPRMSMRPVAGLPLLHIDKPSYKGANRLAKAMVDRIGAVALVVLVSPALAVCALAITLDSRGPVFYRSERIGPGNEPFLMWKFRSMVTGADRMKDDLADLDEGAGALFKIREDPRVTRVGKVIRRFSIDELPQLFNVIGGSMSLVGPRPPLAEEVERYDGPVARRMLVRPGMTGLWQVSGRSDLTWEESVRLDLSYVENWSAMSDAMIMWRTLRAVVGRSGAY
ncbi:sugar transferase [Williamsia sp. MIQD14]|uniref:sugar transferase n=1 Tax=Williamsia sp. MIQD14 TaxID=3425703 RepID=UPI003DA1A6F2